MIEAPEGARLIDGSGKTVIPALIDAHTHLGYQGRHDWGGHNYNPETLRDNLEQYAWYGFVAAFPRVRTPLKWRWNFSADKARNIRTPRGYCSARAWARRAGA